MLEQPRIVERQDDRILDLDGGGRLDAARQVLLRGRARRCTTARRRNPACIAAASVMKWYSDADEAPLQAGEAVVRGRRQLRVDRAAAARAPA